MNQRITLLCPLFSASASLLMEEACQEIFVAFFEFSLDKEASSVRIEAMARATARTGVEMEAITAVVTAALTIYDMCKAVDRGMTITDIQLLEKSGGRSGDWQRET